MVARAARSARRRPDRRGCRSGRTPGCRRPGCRCCRRSSGARRRGSPCGSSASTRVDQVLGVLDPRAERRAHVQPHLAGVDVREEVGADREREYENRGRRAPRRTRRRTRGGRAGGRATCRRSCAARRSRDRAAGSRAPTSCRLRARVARSGSSLSDRAGTSVRDSRYDATIEITTDSASAVNSSGPAR